VQCGNASLSTDHHELAWTGLRVSEALGLRWEDIDLDTQASRARNPATCLKQDTPARIELAHTV
jgi:hypothetical protein